MGIKTNSIDKKHNTSADNSIFISYQHHGSASTSAFMLTMSLVFKIIFVSTNKDWFSYLYFCILKLWLVFFACQHSFHLFEIHYNSYCHYGTFGFAKELPNLREKSSFLYISLRTVECADLRKHTW